LTSRLLFAVVSDDCTVLSRCSTRGLRSRGERCSTRGLRSRGEFIEILPIVAGDFSSRLRKMAGDLDWHKYTDPHFCAGDLQWKRADDTERWHRLSLGAGLSWAMVCYKQVVHNNDTF